MVDEPRGDGIEEQTEIVDDGQEPVRLDAHVPKTSGKAPYRIPQTKEWVKFSNKYDFMEVRVWVDAPAKVMEGLAPQQPGENADDVRRRVLDTLGQIVLDHRFADGTPWQDEDGVLPPTTDPVFWDRAPQPIVNAIIAYIRERIANHPTLRRSRETPRR